MYELALVRQPASIVIKPIKVIDGDIRWPETRRHEWDSKRRALLERAATSARGDWPLHIHSESEIRQQERRNERRMSPDELAQALDQGQWARGPVEHSVPYRNSILSVR
jgi:hypothetical protein